MRHGQYRGNTRLISLLVTAMFSLEEARCTGTFASTIFLIIFQANRVLTLLPQTVLRQAAVPGFLNPMQFTKIRFLGGKLGDAMAKEYDANTVGDMLWVTAIGDAI